MRDRASVKTIATIEKLAGGNGRDFSTLSMPFILQSLSLEHDRVFEQYMPRPYAGDVVLFRASKQLQGIEADPISLGWKKVLSGRFETSEVRGHQQSILREPNVSELAEALTERLQALSGDRS